MTRKLKVGLAVLVVLALGAVGASGASAHYIFTPGANPAILTGEQIDHEAGNKFEIRSIEATWACENATLEGTTTANEINEVTVSTSYSCRSFIGGTESRIVVDMNGCDYLLTGETVDGIHGHLHIKCPVGKVIEMTISGINCTLKVHDQTPTAGGFNYENTSPGGESADIDATATIEGMTFERSGGIICAASGIPSEGNNAFLLQKFTVRAYEDKSGKEGAQVNLTVS